MTEREWNKVRLINVINPFIEPAELAKYFCINCALYWSCKILRGLGRDSEIENRNVGAIKFKYPNQEVHIYKCFEEKKNEDKKD